MAPPLKLLIGKDGSFFGKREICGSVGIMLYPPPLIGLISPPEAGKRD